MSIIFEPLNVLNSKQVLEGIAKNFASYEIMGKTLQIDLEELYLFFEPTINNSMLHSYVAKDFNKVVGGIICNDFKFFIDSVKNVLFSFELEAIIGLLSTLEANYIKQHDPNYKEKSYLYQYATYVEAEYNNQGIATELYRLSEENAKYHGFKKLITISTGLKSQYIRINKLNFQVMNSIDYKTFIFKGHNVFADIQEVNDCKLLIKHL